MRPLDGVRVIDFTMAAAGPIMTATLASLGAEVIKVESPTGRPQHGAGMAPLKPGGEDRSFDRAMLFNSLNHGKRAICLDVSQPEGRELFLRLVAGSDVMVQNFSPRVLGNLDLEYSALRAARPDLILVSICAFGLSGAFRDRIAYGPGVDAMSGLSHLTGYADGPPLKPGNFFCDQTVALHAVFATLAALRHRRRTGEGQHVEMPMIDGEFQILADAYIDFAMNGRTRTRIGNDHPWMAPHGVYPCSGDDAWVAIACETDDQWHALCAAIGSPQLQRDERFVDAVDRHRNRSALDAILAAWTSTRDHYEVQHALQAAGVPAGAVLDARELLRDPHIVARETFHFVEQPNVGPTPYARVAFTMSATPARVTKAAPGFAEDTEYVLGDLLGLTADQIANLEQRSVFTRRPAAELWRMAE